MVFCPSTQLESHSSFCARVKNPVLQNVVPPPGGPEGGAVAAVAQHELPAMHALPPVTAGWSDGHAAAWHVPALPAPQASPLGISVKAVALQQMPDAQSPEPLMTEGLLAGHAIAWHTPSLRLPHRSPSGTEAAEDLPNCREKPPQTPQTVNKSVSTAAAPTSQARGLSRKNC